MSDQDFYEVEPTEEKAAPSEEKKDKKKIRKNMNRFVICAAGRRAWRGR